MNARLITSCFLLLGGAMFGRCLAEEDSPDTRLFDTGMPLVTAPTKELLTQHSAWRQIPEDSRPNEFVGDAVVLNDKVGIVFQKGQIGPVLYSKNTGRRLAIAEFVAPGASAPGKNTAVHVLENSAGAVKVAVDYGPGASLHFRLTTGESILEIQSPEGTGSVQVQAETRYLVVPDYFGDDMVYDAGSARVLLPAENFCLDLLGAGEAILMTVWQSRQQDAWFAGSEHGATTRITCAKGKNIWLALLEQPGIWHAEVASVAGAWSAPFPAKWRCSLVRSRDGADSWDLELGPKPEQKAGAHRGPLLTYLIDRTPATPLTVSCPTDVMRNTLGVGPCQYILACEGMGAQGDPTPNTVMGWVEKQFQQKKQKKLASEIQERLGFMTHHVSEARAKIANYSSFATSNIQRFSTSAPEPLLSLLRELAEAAAAGLVPDAAPERAEKLAGAVKALSVQENGLAACRRAGEQLRSIGSIQDRALARCRMTVRRLRQEARTIAAAQPSGAPVVAQLQEAAERLLEVK